MDEPLGQQPPIPGAAASPDGLRTAEHLSDLPAPDPDQVRRLARDRRRRGPRGPIAADTLPWSRTPAEEFVEDVEVAWGHLADVWPVLRGLQMRVEEVPPAGRERELATLGRGAFGRPRWLAIYRRPIEQRSQGRASRRRVIAAAISQALTAGG